MSRSGWDEFVEGFVGGMMCVGLSLVLLLLGMAAWLMLSLIMGWI
jgi:hypothetical protein